MGLDIMMYKVIRKEEVEPDSEIVMTFSSDETNKSILELKEKFIDRISKVTNEYLDIEKAEELGIIPKGYVNTGMSIGQKGTFLRFADPDEDGDEDTSIEVNYEDIPTYEREDEVLYGHEIEYQRKCMSDKFYTDFLSGCWYMPGESDRSYDDSNEVISTKKKFDEARKYLLENSCPMMRWDFVEGENFIYFSY